MSDRNRVPNMHRKPNRMKMTVRGVIDIDFHMSARFSSFGIVPEIKTTHCETDGHRQHYFPCRECLLCLRQQNRLARNSEEQVNVGWGVSIVFAFLVSALKDDTVPVGHFFHHVARHQFRTPWSVADDSRFVLFLHGFWPA